MDGIHDLGGKQGFGRIDVDEPEEPFHEAWEGRVLGMVLGMSRPADWNIDWFRHCRELIEPVDYLTRPYYDQWLQTYAAMMINSGIATVDELVRGHATAQSGLPAPKGPEMAPGVARTAVSFARDCDQAPAFNVGDRVRALSDGISGHTRLPAYVRGRAGVIEKYNGAHIFADANAVGDPVAMPLYTVGFAAAELWPEEAQGRRDQVFLDLWEAHLNAD